jgi:hypothetical protein
VSPVDPDAVQVFARVFHRVWCLRGSDPDARFSRRHGETDARIAGLMLSGLNEAGLSVTSEENR